MAVGEQHDLEQHGGRISCRSSHIVVESRIKVSRVDLLGKQVVQSVFDGAGPGMSCHCRSTARKRGLVSMYL
ncbi:MAG: hypothetical protein M3P47_06295 [Pseudomonadota bacterium]|nr:hypothetical protein [Pseudomonadota bacterium]